MKKSSLITLTLASLVGLVACNQGTSMSKVEKATETFIIETFKELYYHDDDLYLTDKNGNRVKDADGNYIKIHASKGETKEDTFLNAFFLNPEAVSEMEYYLAPDYKDSFATMFSLYDGLTEEELDTVASDGNLIRDNLLNNGVYYSLSAFLLDDIVSIFGFDVAYATQGVIELLDVDEDTVNDYGHSIWVNYSQDESFDQDKDIFIQFEVVSMLYQFEGDSTYTLLSQVSFFSTAELDA